MLARAIMRRMDLLQHFQRTMRAMPVERGQTVIVGVSGGADSMALLHLFVRSQEALGITPVAVHVNHQIRGAEADADERFVKGMAATWGAAIHAARFDVPGLAQSRKLTLEEAARQARYALLGKAARESGSSIVAVAHNADDQAETVLMHLLRGSGLAGLRGMLAVSRMPEYPIENENQQAGARSLSPLRVIRPLLEAPRGEIEAYCAEQGIEARMDSTNLDTSYFRNRLRHEIMPMLAAMNPNVRAALGRTASVLAGDYEIVQTEISRAWQRIVKEETDERVALDLAGWRSLPEAIQRGTIRRAVGRLRAGLRDLSFEHVEGAVRAAREGGTGAWSTLPGGLMLAVGYETLTIAGTDRQGAAPDWPLLEPGTSIEVSGAGEIALPGGWRFSAAEYDGPRSGEAWTALLADPWAAAFDAARLAMPLVLRTRRPGDRFTPQGAGGSQKLGDFMINAKIPSAWRDHVPLLASGGEIAWVCGWRVDERFIVQEETRRVWVARFERER